MVPGEYGLSEVIDEEKCPCVVIPSPGIKISWGDLLRCSSNSCDLSNTTLH